MSLAEEAASSPRTRFGMMRRSAWNTSFPESHDGVYALRFTRFGRVPLGVHEGVRPEEFAAFADEVFVGSGGEISPKRTRNLLLDVEAGVLHWAADVIAEGQTDITGEVQGAALKLAEAIEGIRALSRVERKILENIIDQTSPVIRRALRKADDLDPVMLRACLVRKRKGRRRTAKPEVSALLDGFIDGWKRRTGQQLTFEQSAGSAHHFFISAMEILAKYPPSAGSSPVQSKVAEGMRRLRLDVAKPWDRAARSEAENPSP